MAKHAIRARDLEGALAAADAEIIEDYPTAIRGPCYLVLSWVNGRAMHAVITHPPLLFVITAYWPDSQPHKWDRQFRRRL